MGWTVAGESDLGDLISYYATRCGPVPGDRLRRFGISSRTTPRRRYFLYRDGSRVTAAVFHGPNGFFYPMGLGELNETARRELRRILGLLVRAGTVMGPARDVEILCSLFRQGKTYSVEYRQMHLRSGDFPDPAAPPVTGLTLFTPDRNDWERLLPLQIAYEKEEVLLPGRIVNPHASKAVLLDSLEHQIVLAASRNDTVVARVATNAVGYGCNQIGGVYTDPTLRNNGVARWMMSELLQRFKADAKDAVLFVKPENGAAIALYTNLGFRIESDFRINYYF